MRKSFRNIILVVLIVLMFLFAGCASTSKNIWEDNSDNMVIHFYSYEGIRNWGDCTFIRFPNGETMLIDSGLQVAGKSFCEDLLAQGITEIDYLVISHYHADHVNGLREILPNIKFKYALTTGYCPTNFIWVDEELEKYGIQVKYVSAGDSFSIGDARFDVLWPLADDIHEKPTNDSDVVNAKGSILDINNNSMVFTLTYGQNTILFPGDIYERSEEDLIKYYSSDPSILDCDVLKIMHHGINTSSSQAFIAAVSPQYAFSMGTYTMSAPYYLRYYTVGCETYMSWQNGDAYVILNGEDINVKLDDCEVNAIYTKYTDALKKL